MRRTYTPTIYPVTAQTMVNFFLAGVATGAALVLLILK